MRYFSEKFLVANAILSIFTLVLVISIFSKIPEEMNIPEQPDSYTIYLVVQEPEEGTVSEAVVQNSPAPEVKSSVAYTDEEIDLIALMVMAEAENQPELGQRLVIDTVLNRLEHPNFPKTVHDVVYAPNQFVAMTNGRADRCYVKESIRQLVVEEMQRKTDDQVIYFRSGHFHEFATDLYKVGDHYFSAYQQ